MDAKIRQGTAAWFDMVGQTMCEAALRAELAPDLNLTLIERYTDGIELADCLIQGLRFDIIDGRPSFRSGARRDEQGDIIIQITAAAARELNLLHNADPQYPKSIERVLTTGEMQVDGDPSLMGSWLKAVHDPIVDRTK
ncbi:hypothetical protein FHX14_000680 [Rhizobium sp. BK619]|uniref:hypothetical protein n=1 Tax=Rhizobium sp. BK619 TaxID=2586989 RepID=UPI00160B848C|nr:hypothetical protein [Rhizobium sp. BK619]MBB3644521.1 hypothetical protein [Rhizobium sp. BK619]